MQAEWKDAVFYHIYPLGAFGAPQENDGTSRPEPRIDRLREWIPAMKRIGAEYLYLGPVFESERHGYDTVDYLTVDRRLGSNDDLKRVCSLLRENGISVVPDAVFNHVGRRHPFVRDVAERGPSSPYARWIAGYSRVGPGRGGLPFTYEGWKGHYDLVKLDTANPEVREYLIGIALSWIEDFGISGLRLDAADCLDRGFIRLLGDRCRSVCPSFFMLGEAVHGDLYDPLLELGGLDSVTNYEAWKGLWSSYNDKNYYEISWTLNRLFGEGGLVKGKTLYSFADNHDVDRVASLIRDNRGLYPLYALLFSMPGIPSVYYGSEYAIVGKKGPGDDRPLRPEIIPDQLETKGNGDLVNAIGRFSAARRGSAALRRGSYRSLVTESEGLAFLRAYGSERVVVALNAGLTHRSFRICESELAGREMRDLLDGSYASRFDRAGCVVIDVPPHWTRWISVSLDSQI